MWKKRWLRVVLGAVVLIVFAAGGFLFWVTRPHYAWLTFGPEQRVRLLICDRGLWIATSRFVDGNRVGPVERFRAWGGLNGMTLDDPDGRTTYTITRAQNFAARGDPVAFMAYVDIDGPVAYQQYCDLSFAARDPQSARVAHFNGPLTAGPVTVNWKLPDGLALARGDDPTTLRALVGTMDAARGCWVAVSSQDEHLKPAFGNTIRPEVEIAFAAPSEGQPPIIQRYVLDQVCCGCVFYAPTRVPDDAGDVPARVTFSFPTWSAGRVASSTIELPLAPARPAPKAAEQASH
jgi:hypothetical protein